MLTQSAFFPHFHSSYRAIFYHETKFSFHLSQSIGQHHHCETIFNSLNGVLQTNWQPYNKIGLWQLFPHSLEHLLKQLGTESSSLWLVTHSKTTSKHSTEKVWQTTALNNTPSPGRWTSWTKCFLNHHTSCVSPSLLCSPFRVPTAASRKHNSP